MCSGRSARCKACAVAGTTLGRFVVLEGIDGCGKTTQLERLRAWLPGSGLMPAGARLLTSREPGGTPLGQALRQLLLAATLLIDLMWFENRSGRHAGLLRGLSG